jgi:regulator of sirC expression with transglutaminase-like and TPR domain
MSSNTQPPQISSLIRLLDDRDPFVTDQVGNRLVELGTEAVPLLEMASRGENLTLRTRALGILERIAPRQLADAFRNLSRTRPEDDIDLEQGVLLLMQFGHPSADPEQVRQQLDQLAGDLAPKIKPEESTTRILGQLTNYLFRQRGFHGNQDNYIDPDNSYFDTVLKNKTGLPIALSVLCILIGQRLQIPIVGIGLPYHFIAKYNSATDPILFDPFHRGRILTPEKCSEMVQGFGIQFEDHYLYPVTHREILTRMIQNLANAYQKLDEEEKVNSLKEYSQILMGQNKRDR